MKVLGRKGETYDQIIRRRIVAGIDLDLLKRLRGAEDELSIPEDRIPWHRLYRMSDKEFDDLLRELGSARD